MAQAPRPAHVRWFSDKPKRRGKGRGRRSPCQLAALRMRCFAKYLRDRYGVELPDDDAGRDEIEVAASHLASLAHPKGRIEKWLGLWAPWISVREQQDVIAKAITEQKHWTADQLAWRLGLTDADRTRLGITTIGAIDCSKAERKARRRQKQRDRMLKLRRSRGAKPRTCAP